MPVSEQVVDSITIANTKNLGDAPAEALAMVYQGLAQTLVLSAQNAVSNQQLTNEVARASTTQAINRMLNMDVEEAGAIVKASTGNDVASELSALLAALNSGTQGVKAAVNTPPVTSK